MKKECEQTRQALPKYLRGHVFRGERTKIERHLGQCILCRSELDALRRIEETRQLLRDIHAEEGVVGRVQDGVTALAKVRRVLYRPLWIAGIAAVAAAVAYYVMTPRQLDLEIERIVQSAPASSLTATAPAQSAADPAPAPAPAATTAVTATTAPQAAAPPADAVPDPLVVTIVPDNDTTAVRRINDVMHGHGRLRKLGFSDTQKEVAASLTSKELLTFFNRIEPFAKVSFNRKRFESFPTAVPVPFVLKLKAAPRSPAPAAATPARPAAPAAPAAPPAAVSAPSATPGT